ncbi:hypothetical protein BDW02DRAFT_607467, partial [Decorospora gaudefroyi]
MSSPPPPYTREQFLTTYITPTTPSTTDDTTCPICLDPFNTTTRPAVTFSSPESCSHIYCHPCILTWLNEPFVNSCGMCRRELFTLPNDEDDDDDDDWDDPYYYYYHYHYYNGTFTSPTLLPRIIPPRTLRLILERTWFEIWSVCAPYPQHENHPSASLNALPDSNLPTPQTLTNILLDSIALYTNCINIYGSMSSAVLRACDEFLRDVVEYQVRGVDVRVG